jgi:hypothetical protein
MEEEQETIRLDVIHVQDENINVSSGKDQNSVVAKTYVTSNEYQTNDALLFSMKMPEIRDTLKFYKNSMVMPTSMNNSDKRLHKQAIKTLHDFTLIGTKQKLVERLQSFFVQDLAAIHVQRVTRGYFVKLSDRLRGPAHKNRSLCVNTTDFYTMEPIEEISNVEFYSYADKDGFIYGFDINSLVSYIKQSNKRIKNPYNRHPMDELYVNIFKLNRLNAIIRKKYVPPPRAIISPVKRSRRDANPSAATESGRRQNIQLLNPYLPMNYNVPDMIGFIRDRRAMTIEERLRLIFIDIDHLGNYTQMSWLSNLQLRGYIRFFRILKDIWTYRAQLSHGTKVRICPLWDPFMILSQNGVNLALLDQMQWLALSVSVIEDMVCTGVDVEHRTLGAFHILSALTIVSAPARASLPWLYESLVW